MIREIKNQQEWNDFLLKYNPNTFLQSWEWGQACTAEPEGRSGVQYLGIFEGGQQIGAALVLEVPARRGPHILIPHGPVFKSEEEARKYLPEIVEYVKSHPHYFSPAALRIAPLLLSSPENVSAFKDLGFRDAPMHVHAELTWVLDINKSEEELLAGMRKTTRHAIRRAQESGVTVEITTDKSALSRFLPLYEQTKHRHDFIPYSYRLIQSQFKTFTESRSPNIGAYLAIAHYQNKDIAAGIFFHFGNTVFYYHGASIQTPAKVSPAQLLQWTAIKEAKRRGATRFNFWGIAPDDQPKHPFAGITIFKKGFGGYALDYMHAQDLPLSGGYWKLWLVDMYRKIRRGF